MKNTLKINQFTEQDVLSLAKKGYYEGKATFDINPKRCALLVIDMQDEFVKPHWTPDWVPEATKMVPRLRKVIDHCREMSVPVIYTVFSNTHHYFDRPKSGKYMPIQHSDLGIDSSEFYVKGEVWHELAPLDNEIIIHKPSYGAFHDTPLETILRNLDKDTVIISGTLTNFCCDTTARQAYARSFKVIFGSDITGADDPDLQEPELRIMRKGFARVMSAEEIIKSLI
ncbi:Peroxyureidoacrylate/ureidoacrylate amidohydrolase RutB [Candidatus Lokiarchaeum ossiferum]|uniref:Peroxyureidoacrylate/ureidoacrylate amidohydrolase RutB n=1 Tax=Candidatus Lokiarchaeum ossiferum TaxID=2951803 RepID=A0ABY6HL59_9ARCH|nr:Peroxyureidoacrylate/ureidoacrylate amidohydrolase RutB [Candidatus Lokiarchaeum sp. B-35]